MSEEGTKVILLALSIVRMAIGYRKTVLGLSKRRQLQLHNFPDICAESQKPWKNCV